MSNQKVKASEHDDQNLTNIIFVTKTIGVYQMIENALNINICIFIHGKTRNSTAIIIM